MDEYSTGQHVIYEEDGAFMLTEVVANESNPQYECYRLKLLAELTAPSRLVDGAGRILQIQHQFEDGRVFRFEKLRGANAFGLGTIIELAPKELVEEIISRRN